jgi:hypothetical protein
VVGLLGDQDRMRRKRRTVFKLELFDNDLRLPIYRRVKVNKRKKK